MRVSMRRGCLVGYARCIIAWNQCRGRPLLWLWKDWVKEGKKMASERELHRLA